MDRGRHSSFICCGLIVLALGVCPASECPADRQASEGELKAAFLYNFARFVTWPADAQPADNTPFHLCVIGGRQLRADLVATVQGKEAAGHPIRIVSITGAATAFGCHIVFIPSEEQTKAKPLLEALRPKSVLTVGEWEGFLGLGGIINLKVEAGRIGMEINPDAAERARLQISAKLYNLARIVKDHAVDTH